jgi:hypothetical protein
MSLSDLRELDLSDELCRLQDKIAALTIERDKLRAALEEIAILGEQGMKPDYSEWLTFHDKVAQIARRALATDGKYE